MKNVLSRNTNLLIFFSSQYYQLLDDMISKLATDGKGLTTDEYASGVGLTVGSLVDKFSEQDRLQIALDEAKEFKKLYEKAIKEKEDLEAEINMQEGIFFIYLHI